MVSMALHNGHHESLTSSGGSHDDSQRTSLDHVRDFEEAPAGRLQGAADSPSLDADQIGPIVNTGSYRWSGYLRSREDGGSLGHPLYDGAQPPPLAASTNGGRPSRPSAIRTPSNAYAPVRRPSQYKPGNRSLSSNRLSRRNPEAEFRAQQRAYVQRLRQDVPLQDEYGWVDDTTPGLDYDSSSATEEETPSTTGDYLEDPYDQETLLYYGNDDMLPSVEELKIPANRERLEWHSMLANVLTGEVVKQEKKRLTGTIDTQGDNVKSELWIGIRARTCGRTLAAQRRMIEDGRLKVNTMIEAIIAFKIQGEAEVGKDPTQQVEDIVAKILRCESLYPTRLALKNAHPRAASEAFDQACDAVISWLNTTELIHTELNILRKWVGNDELDFQKPRERPSSDSNLNDDSPFIDRILKEDGLASLHGKNSLLIGVKRVIHKAKATLITNHHTFQDRHLPPYIEELLTLINFPSRLIQEFIHVRLTYAKRMKDPAQQGVMMAEQMISQFQILLKLAVFIKQDYTVISRPEPGWDLPPCIDEAFDSVVLDALRFYFKTLTWKLTGSKNRFKEAEILEQEWGFANEIGRHLDGGDVEVAEQFGNLTSRSLQHLANHFERELQRRPDEVAGAEMDRRYKQILDSVRIRQRKLFRFSRTLTQKFENCAEYNINISRDDLKDLCDALYLSHHSLIEIVPPPAKEENHRLYIIASPTLMPRAQDIETIMDTCYHTEDRKEDPNNPYVLILRPEHPIDWPGQSYTLPLRKPQLDVKVGRLRLIADGAQQRLQNAKLVFLQSINMKLDVLVEQRANIKGVNKQLQEIKKHAYKLSNTIMDSVDLIRKQTAGLECQELIQNCFAFATEFGQRSVLYMDQNRRAMNNIKMTRLALDWVSFICDDCVATDRKTFRWAVNALEFAMIMTRGQNILSISDSEYARLRAKVAGCMSLLISHFDIMGARSMLAAQAEKQRVESMPGKLRFDVSCLKDDEESAKLVQEQWMAQLAEIDELRKQREAERQALGRVLEDSNEADRSLTYLSSAATNVTLRWQQGQFVGGGTFGSVYSAINLDTGYLMAVKEIRLQDPQLIPTIAAQIRDEMNVLQVLDHPNVVQYHGIEVHRDKVYIFMEYCSGGSLATLLEHGRIEDETVIMVYVLQLLEGLDYLHHSGVIHRDIKPENVLLDQHGVIKYVDFGAAKVIARQGKTMIANAAVTSRKEKSMQGTPMYMSPEVIRGDARSGRPGAVDIWSLGCVVLEMATGRRPWACLDNEWAIMYNIAQGNQPQLPTRDQLSESGIDFLKKCFERDPMRRATAAELLQHEWIMTLRNQLSLEPATPNSADGSVSGGASSGGPTHSRQNSIGFQ